MEVARTQQPHLTLRTPQPPPTSRSGNARDKGNAVAAPPWLATQEAQEALAPSVAPPSMAETQKQKAKEDAPIEDVREMVEDLNAKIASRKEPQIKFAVDSESGDVIVQIVDKETEEVIRQIPPEELVALRERIAEMRGILFDTRG